MRRVLVVGAGIAGSTAAYWLARAGCDTTVVERAGAQSSSGSPVDVRGPAIAVVEEMGLLAPLRAAATRARRLALVDDRGRTVGWIPTQAGAAALEVPRGDLAAVLTGAAREHAEYIVGDTVTALHDDGHGVDVAFEHGPPRRFDLVVGADGLHSRVRRLAFGPESRYVGHLGLDVAVTTLDRAPDDPTTVLIHNTPGRAVTVHPGTGREIAAFIFRAPAPPLDRTAADERRLVTTAYAGVGWRAPELLERVREADDLYLDAVSRVRLDSWSRGRVVLVGDAADCVSLFGEGSSTAITGARTLAAALAAVSADPRPALGRYEHVHRRRVRRRHRGVAATSHLLVPTTRAGMATRDLVFRVAPVLSTLALPEQRSVSSAEQGSA